MSGFSSHADQNDFDAFLGPLAKTAKHTRLVHGEMEPATALAARLASLGFADVAIPDRGEAITLSS
jgi:metallo-beta-lactamase family protein